MKPSTAATATIDAYIAEFLPEVRARLTTVRATIREAAPDAVEKISYRMPTFHMGGNLVHFAAFAKHVGFYPGAGGVAAFADRLTPYVTGKGSVQFPHDEPLPLALIADIVRFRVDENRQKSAGGERRRPR